MLIEKYTQLRLAHQFGGVCVIVYIRMLSVRFWKDKDDKQ